MTKLPAHHQVCPKDGFPLVHIEGRWRCVAEYLDRCVGGHRLVDVQQEGETVYYIFDNGHALPILCCCCGQPMQFADVAHSRQDMLGRRLEAMSWQENTLEETGQAVLEFVLEFSAKGRLDYGTVITTSLQSANQLRHPADCPQHSKSAKTVSTGQRPH